MHCIQFRNELGKLDSTHIIDVEIVCSVIKNAGEKDLNNDGINLTAVLSDVHIHHNIIMNNSGNGIDVGGQESPY